MPEGCPCILSLESESESESESGPREDDSHCGYPTVTDNDNSPLIDIPDLGLTKSQRLVRASRTTQVRSMVGES